MLLGAVERQRVLLDVTMRVANQSEHDQALELLKANLSSSDFARIWRSGELLSMEQAVELAQRSAGATTTVF